MGRPLRTQFDGAIYHVTARGNNARLIFIDDRDRELFLQVFATTLGVLQWRCHAFCLMGNHYHLLLETPNGDLGIGMCRLNGQYARGFNRRHGRRGHLFEQRYHAVLINREAHLLEACRYIVLNPVRAALCEAADEWKWSSFRSTAGLVPPLPFLAVEALLQQFGPDLNSARDRYTAFVAEGSEATSLQALIAA